MESVLSLQTMALPQKPIGSLSSLLSWSCCNAKKAL
jgi:hypothetical protein